MKSIDLKKTKEKFIMPKAEIVIFDTKDVISTSGGFDGEWDEDDIPPAKDIDMPKIGF